MNSITKQFVINGEEATVEIRAYETAIETYYYVAVCDVPDFTGANCCHEFAYAHVFDAVNKLANECMRLAAAEAKAEYNA